MPNLFKLNITVKEVMLYGSFYTVGWAPEWYRGSSPYAKIYGGYNGSFVIKKRQD